jgi:DNA-binding transcriptional MerR regulator
MDIGDVRTATGLSAATLHHYEQLGLIESTSRRGLRRQYDDAVVERLAVIALCQRSGFTLGEIKALLSHQHGRGWKTAAAAKLAELDARIADLQLARTGIEHALQCPSPDIMTCEHFRSSLSNVFTSARA